MCERTCSYSKRHSLLILWFIGNRKTQVWSFIIHITFLKHEDDAVSPGMHMLPFLSCAHLCERKRPFAPLCNRGPSSFKVVKYELLCLNICTSMFWCYNFEAKVVLFSGKLQRKNILLWSPFHGP